MSDLPLNQIVVGDCRAIMAKWPAESVDFVMFSPPYYGLRDYSEKSETIWDGDPGCEHGWLTDKTAGFCVKCDAWRGQLGLEPSWQMYVDHLSEICREVKRVLKPTGSMYIVIGDTYSGGSGHSMNGKWPKLNEKIKPMDGSRPQRRVRDIPSKCLMGIPWRLAFALIDDGWILRNDIIWYKPNHMPSSVKDRLTNSYEHIFHFVKQRKYHYDLDAIRIPHKTVGDEQRRQAWNKPVRYDEKQQVGLRRDGRTRQEFLHSKGKNPGDVISSGSKFLKHDVRTASPGARSVLTLKEGKLTTEVKKALQNVGQYLKDKRKQSGLSFDELETLTGVKRTTLEHYFRTDFSGQALPSRQTWDLLKPLLGLGDYDDFIREEIRSALPQPHPLGRNPGDFWSVCTKPFKEAHFAVYPAEICVMPILAACPVDGIVVDPMLGSGTTCAVAKALGRHFVGIDLNPEYVEIAKKRITNVVRPLAPITNYREAIQAVKHI